VFRETQFWNDFRDQEHEFYRRQSEGIERCRRGFCWLHKLRLATDGAHCLFDTERGHRVRFAGEVFRVVLERFGVQSDGDEVSQEAFFVTLVPSHSHFVTSDEPDALPIHALRQWVSSALRNFSYVGMIEPAYFVNVGLGPFEGTRLISWHAHLLVWGCSRRELSLAIRRINRREEPLFPGAKVALSKRVEDRELGETLAYVLKSPTNQYTASPRRDPRRARPDAAAEIDPDGLRSRILTAMEPLQPTRCRIRKSEMSGLNLVRLFRVMWEVRLDHLLIAGGDGSELRKTIVDRLPRPRQRHRASRSR